MEQPVRRLLYYGDHFQQFYGQQPVKVQRKVDQVLFLIGHMERVPEKFLKHVEGVAGLYEIRVLYRHYACRIFCFFSRGGQLILLNGFLKKSAKTPAQELQRAIRLMNEYQFLN